jgi:hypothetical protein
MADIETIPGLISRAIIFSLLLVESFGPASYRHPELQKMLVILSERSESKDLRLLSVVSRTTLLGTRLHPYQPVAKIRF